MSDRLVRAISKDGYVKAVAVSTRDLTERAPRSIRRPRWQLPLWAVHWQLHP